MAKGNKTSFITLPEQRVAGLLAERMSLKPPVAIQELARRFAVVEEDELPRDSDAVVYARPGSRPVIVLNRKQPPTRKRFTLAHELGHVLIPWHIGTVACHTEWVFQTDDIAYGTAEAEANRFASELLMPRHWVLQQVRSSKGLKEAFAAVHNTGVSPHAVSVALIQVLDPGYVFVVANSEGRVSLSGTSPGTLAKAPIREELFVEEDYDRLSSRKLRIEDVLWWYFDPKSPPATPDDSRSATLILHEMLKTMNIRGMRAEKLTQSINGIIGAANSAIQAQSTSELYAALRQRFLSRPDLRRVTTHKDFDAFLAQRAREILGRRDAPKRG